MNAIDHRLPRSTGPACGHAHAWQSVKDASHSGGDAGKSKSPNLEGALDQLVTLGDWRSWCWAPTHKVFTDPELFR